MTILVVVEHDRGVLADASREALTAGRHLATTTATPLDALTIGAAADAMVAELGRFGVSTVHQAHHDVLADYGPEAWGAVVAAAVEQLSASVVVAAGTDRGNEVMAWAAARLDVPFAANCTVTTPGEEDEKMAVTRVRWGGSLLEEATLTGAVRLLTMAHHAVDAAPAEEPGRATAVSMTVELDDSVSHSIVRGRVERVAGVTLATAPVVVGGGRGVGSADGFAPLEELAGLLGGVVGCSRAVTNNGWRNHTDQVGQTGTRIAPTVYLACGISGAIQHWVGAMAAKNIVAINIDPEANMVSKAGYAVIGDLHAVVPAIATEIRRRRGT
ncbi:MAG: electron transfer flavoprotein subunit alpha/FixB family protein [Acidimicrobiia bacterium]|nr:electron transfer flavoprotein subunit alpha/FixB family protein [Acidimicrobiia bacterium]